MPHPPAVKHRANRLSFPENRDALPDALTTQYPAEVPDVLAQHPAQMPLPRIRMDPETPS